jgi:hypothetical protein
MSQSGSGVVTSEEVPVSLPSDDDGPGDRPGRTSTLLPREPRDPLDRRDRVVGLPAAGGDADDRAEVDEMEPC